MTALIIDDDLFYCNILQDYCKKANITVIETFQEPLKALAFLKKHTVDVIFLDIHLPDLNGFELLESLPKTDIIVTTQDETKAVKAFDYNVIDFLLKPIEFSRFLKAVQKIEEKQEAVPEEKIEHIFVNINKRLVKVEVANINFIEAKGNYIQIDRTPHEKLMVHTTLKKIKELLPEDNFIQVHRSFVINTKKIVDIEDSSIVIGRKVIPLGKSHRTTLMEKLNLLN